MIAVLDTGAVTALAPNTERARARCRELLQHVDDLVLPAAVLAEGLLSGHAGRDYHVNKLLSDVEVLDIDELLGLAAGQLRTLTIRGGAHPKPSGVDAIVAGAAASAGDEVLLVTSDTEDMAALLLHAEHRGRVSILAV